MSEIAAKTPPPSRAMSRKTAIVGIGETDYNLDYQANRTKAPGFELPTPETLAKTAFERALADSGLRREDIDGVSVSFTYGGPSASETAQLLGLSPRYMVENGNIMAGPLPVVSADILAGKCDTVAMIYAVASRSMGRQYGGNTYLDGEGAPYSYYYFHPWGWSSQAAHWALAAQYYQSKYGTSEEDLGAVAVQLRKNAQATDHAVMKAPMSYADYMASRYIVRPLHLFDMCLVNDGAVCLIVTRTDKARDLPHTPVEVAGWSNTAVKNDKLHYLVREGLRPQLQEAGALACDMAGIAMSDIQHFEGYDPASIHLVNQLEGFGLVEPGSGLAAFRNGDLAVGGRLPVNTAGGMMSGSYMHGWNHVVEVVRQLRHEAGARQIEGVEISMSSLAQTDQVHPIIFTRGA